MKKGILLLGFIFTLIYSGLGQVVNENFDYANDARLDLQSGWARHSGTGNDLLVKTGNLSMTNYISSNIGNYLRVGGSSSSAFSDDANYGFTAISSGFVYISFLITASNAGTGTYLFHTIDNKGSSPGSNFNTRLFAKKNGTALNFGTDKTSTGTYSSTAFSFNTTYLIIFRYEFKAAVGDDEIKLWVKTAVPQSEADLGTADVTDASGTDATDIESIAIRQANQSIDGYIDGIRLGNGSTSALAWKNLGLYSNYYYDGSGAVEATSNWTSKADGTGDNPENFSQTYKTYNIYNSGSISDNWTVSGTNSKIVVGDGSNACAFSAPYNVVTQDLEIKASASFTLNSGKALTVNGTLTNSAGNTGLVIESGGSLINNTASIGATVKREIASDTKWHLLSSPISGQLICNGKFAPSTDHFDATYGATYDFFYWSETAGSLNWVNLKNSDWSLNTAEYGATPEFTVKKGYLVNYGASFSGSTTKSFEGNLNTGDQSITLTHSGNTWNLIGNPFPSAIDWSAIDKTNLSENYCYIYNPSKAGGAGYEAQDGGYIAAMQGFFVAASGNSLSIPNSARAHNNSWMKNSSANVENQLNIKLGNMTNYDETVVKFIANGNINKDRSDAFKLFSLNPEIPQVYTVKNDEVNVCINSLPFFAEPFSVPLGMLIPANGNYSIELSGFESFPSVPGILLEDFKTQATQNMVQNPVYSFNATTSDNDNRFILHFSGPIGISEKPAQQSYLIFASGTSLYVVDKTGKNQGNVQVYNMMGQLITAATMNGNSTLKLNIDVPVGYYIVKVVSAETTQSSKVFMQ